MLKIEKIQKSYGNTRAVDGLSLSLIPGEILGLLGPNGAGKSTTVNIACGLLEPDAGTVELVGLGPPTRPEVRKALGVAPQELALYEEFTGEENVALFARLFGYNGSAAKQRVRASLEFVGLWDRARDQARQYSGGMKRRLNLAMAVVHEPKLLLLDEPTVGVDPQSRNAILDNVLELKRRGITVIYTTHYMEEAQKICDRVAVVDHGRLQAIDTVEALIARYGGRTAIVLEGENQTQRIECDDPVAELSRLQAAGKLRDFRVERPNLETVFLRLTGRTLRD